MLTVLNYAALRLRKVIVGSDVTLLLLAGLLYGWSVFVKPLEEEFGWLRSETSLTYTIAVASNTFSAWMAARIAKKIGTAHVVRIAAAVVMLGFLLASRSNQLWQLYLGYGVLSAGGLGMTYNVIMSTIVHWYPEKQGLMSGVMLMCYGLGALVFSGAVVALIEALGWRSAFMILGVVCFVVMLVGAMFVRAPGERQVQELPPPKAAKRAEVQSAVELSPRTMIKERSFWLFALWNLALATIGLNMTSHASPMAQALGLNAGTAALYVSALSLSNGASRMLFGAVFDRLGRRLTMLIINGIAVAGSLLLFASFMAGWQIGLLVSIMLIGAAFGGAPISSAIFIKSMYGARNYGENLGFGNLSVFAAAILGPYISGLIYQFAGYQLVCIVMAALGILGVGLGAVLYRLKDGGAN